MALASDSSTFVAYVQGDSGRDVELLVATLKSGELALPPVVVAELLSQPGLPAALRDNILKLPMLDIEPQDYWVRAAGSRAAVLTHTLRARLADSLIAQSCIDAGVPLITRDADFRHFEKHCGLKLA